jgi:hypothetical protein
VAVALGPLGISGVIPGVLGDQHHHLTYLLARKIGGAGSHIARWPAMVALAESVPIAWWELVTESGE